MPQITVWKCNHTKKLFEHKSKYIQHLKALAVKRRRQQYYNSFINSINDAINGEQECANAQELCEYVISHSKEYMASCLLNGDGFRIGTEFNKALREGWKIEWPVFTGMKIYRSHWNNHVSNSHSAPRGKKTNWGIYDKEIPTGYPGWGGNFRIWHDADARIVIHDPKKKKPILVKIPSFSDVSHLSGINTGSGGGRPDGSYYDVKLFAEDFPGMQKTMTYILLKDDTKLDEIGEGRTGYIKDGDPF